MFSFKLFSIFFLISFFSYSQIEIKGTVKDSSNVAIEFANVFLTNQNNEIVTGIVTDKEGSFNLSIKEGTYTLTVSLLGYKDWKISIAINNNINLENIILINNLYQLDEVVVKGKKVFVKRKVDRLVFDVSSSPQAIGGDLTDALKVTPGVIFTNDNLSVFGKDGVKIMINGRVTSIPSGGLTNFLSSIRSEDVRTIEVITNPPARFEAEGNYGLINIIYKKRINFWQARLNSRYIQTTYPTYATGGNFSYFKNKISLFVDLNGKKGSEAVIEESDIFYPNQFWNGRTDRKDKKDYLSGRLSLQYDVSNTLSLGLQYIAGIENPDIRDRNTVDIINIANNALDSILTANGNNNRNNYNHSLNAYGIIKLDTLGRRLTFDIDYFNYVEDQDRDFETQTFAPNGDPGNLFTSSKNLGQQNIKNYSFKTDVEYPLGKFDIDYGGKISFINNDNSVSFFDVSSGTPQFDNTKSDIFDYKENTQSLYVSASHKLNEKWSFKIGVRFENTNTEGFSKTLNQKNKTSYSKLFPTAYLMFIPNENNSLSFSYGKRIKRPKYWEINPFRWYINDFSFAEGNPFLQPSFKDNFEFNHVYKNNLTTILFLSVTNNGFGQIPLVNSDTNILTLTRENYFKRYDYGLGLVYRFSKLSWLSSFIHTQVYYSDTQFNNNIDVSLLGQEQNGTTYSISNYNTFIFNKKKTFLGELNFWCNSEKQTGLYQEEPSYSVSLGLKALFCNNDLQTAINFYDVFKTSNSNITTSYNNGISRIANVYYDNRYFKVSISYRFGNKKIRSRKRRVGNKEEKNRI